MKEYITSKMSNKTWVISDLHLNHDKDFIYKVRGFSSIEEMNKILVENYNSLIQDQDKVYILGDICLGTDFTLIYNTLKELKGQKYLAIGNHDTDKKIEFYKEYKFFKDIQFGYRIKKKKKIFLLTHYPTIVENTTNDSVYNIHGHTHSFNLFDQQYPYCINVSVEACHNYPINLDDIIELIKERKRELNGSKN